MKSAAILLLIAALVYVSACAAIIPFERSLVYFPSTQERSPQASGFADAQSMRRRANDGETIIAWFAVSKGPCSGGNGVFAIDYRGYGGSSGAPTEAGLLRDVGAAYADLAGRGFASRIAICGQERGVVRPNHTLFGASFPRPEEVAERGRLEGRGLRLGAF